MPPPPGYTGRAATPAQPALQCIADRPVEPEPEAAVAEGPQHAELETLPEGLDAFVANDAKRGAEEALPAEVGLTEVQKKS